MKQVSKIFFLVLFALCSAAFNSGYANPLLPIKSEPAPLILQLLPSAKLAKPENIRQQSTKKTIGKFRMTGKDGKMVDVYAAMEWEFTSFYEDGDIYKEYWDYYIRFYSDASHTNAYALTSSITFNYQWAYATSNPNDYGHWTQHATGNIGDFEVYIDEVEIYYADAFGWREVVLSMLPGSGYFP